MLNLSKLKINSKILTIYQYLSDMRVSLVEHRIGIVFQIFFSALILTDSI